MSGWLIKVLDKLRSWSENGTINYSRFLMSFIIGAIITAITAAGAGVVGKAERDRLYPDK